MPAVLVVQKPVGMTGGSSLAVHGGGVLVGCSLTREVVVHLDVLLLAVFLIRGLFINWRGGMANWGGLPNCVPKQIVSQIAKTCWQTWKPESMFA